MSALIGCKYGVNQPGKTAKLWEWSVGSLIGTSVSLTQQLPFSTGTCPWSLPEPSCWPSTLLTMTLCCPTWLPGWFYTSSLWICLDCWLNLITWPDLFCSHLGEAVLPVHITTAFLTLLSLQLLSQLPLWSSPFLMLSDKINSQNDEPATSAVNNLSWDLQRIIWVGSYW